MTAMKVYRFLNSDPRHWQILALTSLFILSNMWGAFGGGYIALVGALFGTLTTQAVLSWAYSAPWQWKSAMITALSLSILLRASDPWMWVFAGFMGVLLKFTLRINGKHIFNPACVGIVIAISLGGGVAWISPGQWGQVGWFIALAIGLAALVLSSARRLDIALGFLVASLCVGLLRAVYLGDPLNIPVHKLQSGAVLVFAFFMITDPRSTPDTRIGRLILASCVAVLAGWLSWQFHLRGSMLYALAMCAPLTPLIDRLYLGGRFVWNVRANSNANQPERKPLATT